MENLSITINNKKDRRVKNVWEHLKLKEHTLYEVKVMWSANNPAHTAFLFTGFENGSYFEIYNNSYSFPRDEVPYYLEIIKELCGNR